MNKVLALLLSITGFGVIAQPKQLCVTVDDLPTVEYGEGNQEEITQKLVAHFQKYNIPAIGFVNERKLYKSGKVHKESVNLLRQWLDRGYELGNHTFSHLSYHKTPFTEFTNDILKGEKVTPPLSKKAGLPWQYFRHPFLHIGQNQARYDSLSTFLESHNYIEAPVTIDNEDYLFAKAYSNAHKKNNKAQMQRIGSDYVKYMEAKVYFYEQASSRLFNRQIPQVLLIHANLLNADYLDELAEMYKRNGYTFVDLYTALQDKAYLEKITKFGNYGISWIDRWALSRSVPKEFFANDPATPDYIVKAAQ
ncbi:polysaccharide deacetylase family protein [Telluribacter sp.]|jgi:peptidoglycan/xylan/chitin deacetylase (PgdA/CDA1 family)|uniref:polysaccharide deacetylase family protein n=1 Tax=Telluribacter sp. TaxID=1978767 RepID=UPI002E0ECF66|nr:polysaccharide deacetylase family protein [Telluribacter sp.]